MLSLNQIVRRIKTIALNHKQVKNFYFGSVTDFLEDKTTRYASVFLQDQPGIIDSDGKVISYSFKLYFLDLEHCAEDTQANTLDVQSDMMQVATDIVAEIDFHGFTDWMIQGGNSFTLVREKFDDFVAGVVVDVLIQIPYVRDICAVPVNNTINAYALYWSYFDIDPYGTIQDEAFLFNKNVTLGAIQYVLDFTDNATGKFLAIKEPATEVAKKAWENTDFNYGLFPDSVFREPIIIGDIRYYVSRIPVVIDSNTSLIKFNV